MKRGRGNVSCHIFFGACLYDGWGYVMLRKGSTVLHEIRDISLHQTSVDAGLGKKKKPMSMMINHIPFADVFNDTKVINYMSSLRMQKCKMKGVGFEPTPITRLRRSWLTKATPEHSALDHSATLP